MHPRSSYPRQVKDAEGNKQVYRLRLLLCPVCGKSHAEIPDFMEKGKHYTAETIKKALSGDFDGISADIRTVERWRRGD